MDGKTSHIDDEDIILTKVKIDENYYNIYNCKSCSFYTDRIHDTAIIKNNKIVDGPSFQLRNNTNVDCLKNSVFSFISSLLSQEVSITCSRSLFSMMSPLLIYSYFKKNSLISLCCKG